MGGIEVPLKSRKISIPIHDDGKSKYFRKSGELLPVYTEQQPRIETFTFAVVRKWNITCLLTVHSILIQSHVNLYHHQTTLYKTNRIKHLHFYGQTVYLFLRLIQKKWSLGFIHVTRKQYTASWYMDQRKFLQEEHVYTIHWEGNCDWLSIKRGEKCVIFSLCM